MNSERKVFRFLNGQTQVVDAQECRGCFMEGNDDLPEEILPIIQNKHAIVRQDAEWPVPAFFIVSARRHLSSIADTEPDELLSIFLALKATRLFMRKTLGLERVQIYQEEKITAPHLHFWLLPIWLERTRIWGFEPKIFDSNIVAYLERFSYRDCKSEIRDAISQLKDELLADSELASFGFTR